MATKVIRPVETGSTVEFGSSVSVFFPAFNDAPSLPQLLQRTFETLERCVTDYEVIVVNDGSSDETGAVLAQLAQEYAPHMRVVTHPQNMGYGAALRSGFRAATKEYIFYTDGDGQYDPRELEKLLRAVGPKTGLVNGYKQERNDPWHRIAIGWLYNRFARWLFGIRLRDIDCDFRLIRRSVFDPGALESTGGTICVELVRQLELSGAEVVELPVHHYARQHGRSQFFRVKSLAITFLQLMRVFGRLVIRPAFTGPAEARPSTKWMLGAAVAIVALSFLAYGRALSLPFISDDYIQIQLARDFAPFDQWGVLAQDALYRTRATSLLMTYWMERTFGLDALAFNVISVMLHAVNALLVFLLGVWRPIGWRVSAVAAAFFAYSQRHSEAVIWHAALPELLVFFFGILAFLCWVRWLQSGRILWYTGTLGSFAFALLSKESAVAMVPLLGIAALADKKPRKVWGLVPAAIASGAYFAGIYAARQGHLHFNDGTFALDAPFLSVLLRSGGGLLWVWGAVALLGAMLGFLRSKPAPMLLGIAWIPLALLPYSFLTYMSRVPSRHTYLASLGLAWIVAAGFVSLSNSPLTKRRRWLTPALMALSIVHEAGYIWTVQHGRYIDRAQPTEALVQAAGSGPELLHASCFPYSQYVADYALRIRLPHRPGLRLMTGPDAAQHPDARNFCNETVEGARY